MHRYQVCFYADDSESTLESKNYIHAKNKSEAVKIAAEICKHKVARFYTVMIWEGPDK
ncbi:hypothetical protein [Acinetobacter soli]|uniref:hypothetical protein n=1 Tax=Acinetobacter soli TaxID=487316 RepID=UPI00148F0887|nr:hypothetical protein [Acinetobacter soli]WEH92415.1 hypothetical protein PYR75_03270 [Acinetobacter soli]WEH98415.1 hypothetical protein PYR76_05165 [Acinetobacter soli]WEI00994.1 hypothetical protein PYR77_02850 [Acinetobacter soli]